MTPTANAAKPSRRGAEASGAARPADVGRVLGLNVPVSVVLAERLMPIETILSTQAGTIIEFDVPFDNELLLFVANSEIGSGQAVKVGENFGLRITRIDPVRERIDALRRPD